MIYIFYPLFQDSTKFEVRGCVRNSSTFSAEAGQEAGQVSVTSDEWVDLDETESESYYESSNAGGLQVNPFLRASVAR